ncbi:MAG: DUF433 domain-containing protein [Chloroflexi bacterium]|nr:DUF433 domain-containing protein [Chloroflexota bacterium]MBP7042530.1 DUF433 domain-containing protein [Chloroflexota bacterium]
MKVLQESILVDCLDRLEAGATVAEILAEYPGLTDELTPFLTTAVALSAYIPPPPAAAQTQARQRFLAEAAALRRQRRKNSPAQRLARILRALVLGQAVG